MRMIAVINWSFRMSSPFFTSTLNTSQASSLPITPTPLRHRLPPMMLFIFSWLFTTKDRNRGSFLLAITLHCA